MSSAPRSIRRFFSLRRYPSAVLILLLVLASFLAWKFFFKKNEDAANYLTANVERMDIQNLVTATGILQPREYVDVGAQVSGQLKKLYVDIGSSVKSGDLLAEIDATVYIAKVDGIRAQVRNQQAQLVDKQAQLTLAQINFERQQNLLKDDATTKESVQTAEANFHSAQAQLQALAAQLQQTQSSLRAEEANLNYARIYAPMTGTVVSITSRQGQTLNANQQAPTIMRIADLSTMTVQTQVSEADIGKLRVGMPVYFTTLGGQDYRWYSKLDRVEPTPTVTNNVVLYNALFDVPNDSHVLMTQMSTQVFFIAARAKDALVIPASAVNFKLRRPGESTDKKSNWQERIQTESNSVKKDSDKEKSDVATNEKGERTKIDGAQTSPDKAANEKPNPTDGKPNSTDEKPNHKRWSRNGPPVAGAEVKPQPVVVQVMDEKGNISERKITIGISNRVQVEVIDGLKEGEKVVSGMRQVEKAATAAASPANPGGAGAGARMMR